MFCLSQKGGYTINHPRNLGNLHVSNLFFVGCLPHNLLYPKALVEIVCLVCFLNVPGWGSENDGLDLVEFFAGRARLSRLASWVGYKVRSYDINYEKVMGDAEFKRGKVRRSPMDLNGAAGFV
jgi:hypothetical protein